MRVLSWNHRPNLSKYSAGASEKVAYRTYTFTIYFDVRCALNIAALNCFFDDWKFTSCLGAPRKLCVRRCFELWSSFHFRKTQVLIHAIQKRNLRFCGILLVSPSTAGSDIGTGHPITFPPQPRTVFLPTDAFPVPGLSWTKGPWINQVLGRCQDLQQ